MAAAARTEIEQFSWRNATLEILREHYPAAMMAARASKVALPHLNEWGPAAWA